MRRDIVFEEEEEEERGWKVRSVEDEASTEGLELDSMAAVDAIVAIVVVVAVELSSEVWGCVMR